MASQYTGRTIWDTLAQHVSLPSRLPGSLEARTEHVEQALVERLHDTCRFLRDLTDGTFRDTFDHLRRTLISCKTVNAGGRLNKTTLLSAFRDLQNDDVLILHVSEQNAGLLIRRCK